MGKCNKSTHDEMSVEFSPKKNCSLRFLSEDYLFVCDSLRRVFDLSPFLRSLLDQ